MRYVDSNIFIYAALDAGPTGDQARSALRQALGSKACTSALTLDEVLWVAKRLSGHETALKTVQNLLQLDVVIHPVERRDVEAALIHFDAGFDPRDAIHAAIAIRRKCKAIVSSDNDFSRLDAIRHEGLD